MAPGPLRNEKCFHKNQKKITLDNETTGFRIPRRRHRRRRRLASPGPGPSLEGPAQLTPCQDTPEAAGQAWQAQDPGRNHSDTNLNHINKH